MDTKARHIAYITSMEFGTLDRELTKEEKLVYEQSLRVLNLFMVLAEKEARKEMESDSK